MAGRSRVMRLKQSIINNIDANTFSGPMKSGTSPSIGVTRNYWYNYASKCNQNPNQIKKSYANMVFLNINPAQTPVTAGFRPTTNYNYSYISPKGVRFYDANAKFDNHYYRPQYHIQPLVNSPNTFYTQPSSHMTGFRSHLN